MPTTHRSPDDGNGVRTVQRRLRGLPTSDGAGVRLVRVIGQPALGEVDPFLLLDEFGTDRPEDYIAGFPDHPHRGFETVTYMLEGRMRHRDNHGHEGVLGPGGVQWMTAGRGIIHSEMPEQQQGRLRGFQLWINLPAREKMTAPRYQDVKSGEIPEIIDDDGTVVRVIVGSFWGKKGPVDGIAADPQYLDISVPAGKKKTFKVDTYRRAFAYVFEGAGRFTDASRPEGVLLEKEVRGEEVNIRDMNGNRTLIRFGTGDEVTLQAGAEGIRFLLISGAPIEEPVAWHGPIVMNTADEIRQAMMDLRNGTFIKPAH